MFFKGCSRFLGGFLKQIHLDVEYPAFAFWDYLFALRLPTSGAMSASCHLELLSTDKLQAKGHRDHRKQRMSSTQSSFKKLAMLQEGRPSLRPDGEKMLKSWDESTRVDPF